MLCTMNFYMNEKVEWHKSGLEKVEVKLIDPESANKARTSTLSCQKIEWNRRHKKSEGKTKKED